MRGQLIEVDVEPAATTYRLVEGHGIQLRHFGGLLRLTPGKAELRIAPGPDHAVLAAAS